MAGPGGGPRHQGRAQRARPGAARCAGLGVVSHKSLVAPPRPNFCEAVLRPRTAHCEAGLLARSTLQADSLRATRTRRFSAGGGRGGKGFEMTTRAPRCRGTGAECGPREVHARSAHPRLKLTMCTRVVTTPLRLAMQREGSHPLQLCFSPRSDVLFAAGAGSGRACRHVPPRAASQRLRALQGCRQRERVRG